MPKIILKIKLNTKALACVRPPVCSHSDDSALVAPNVPVMGLPEDWDKQEWALLRPATHPVATLYELPDESLAGEEEDDPLTRMPQPATKAQTKLSRKALEYFDVSVPFNPKLYAPHDRWAAQFWYTDKVCQPAEEEMYRRFEKMYERQIARLRRMDEEERQMVRAMCTSLYTAAGVRR